MRKLILALLIIGLFTVSCEAKTPYSQKPPIGAQIDWSHPLAKGLVGCWLMNEGGGAKIQDIAGTSHGTFTNMLWKSTIKGSVLSSDTDRWTTNGSSPKLSFATNFTISAWIYPTNYHVIGYFGIFNDFIAKGPSSTFNYVLGTKDATTIQFIKRTGGEGIIVYNFTVPNMTNKWNLVTLTIPPGGGSAYLYINGKFSSSQAIGAIAGVAGDVLYFGGSVPGTDETHFVGYIGSTTIHNRALSPSEIQQLYIDPYCFIKPTTNWDMLKQVVSGIVNTFKFYDPGEDLFD